MKLLVLFERNHPWRLWGKRHAENSEHISKDSKTNYTNPKNIRKPQKKLPDKTLQLYGIKDYFKHVFIPARKNRRVDEIRYISKSYVKAVQVKDDSSIVVYYYFIKENGKWIVHIPEL